MDKYNLVKLCKEYAQVAIDNAFDIQRSYKCSDAEALHKGINVTSREILTKITLDDKRDAVPYSKVRECLVLILKLGARREWSFFDDIRVTTSYHDHDDWIDSIMFGDGWDMPRTKDVMFYMD